MKKARANKIANTLHLRRVLLFLNENKGKIFIRKEIMEKINISWAYLNDALIFLTRYNLIHRVKVNNYGKYYKGCKGFYAKSLAPNPIINL